MPSLAVADRSALEHEQPSLFARLFAFVERSHGRACAALLVLSLVCFLPGFVSLQPMDRDEPRFAQASKQMLETGDFIDIRFQDEARHKKPVGIHWMQSATVAAAEALGLPAARTTIAVYRVPSLIGALATVLLTYWAALAFAGRRSAFLAGAFMAASVILMVEARLAKTDAMLAACSVTVMGALARAYFARGADRLPTATVTVFWGAFALGVLVKGPLVLMFAGLCALVLSIRERSTRWLMPLRPGLGLLFTLAVVAPWFVAIALKSGGAYYTAAVGDDLLGKVATGQQNHWGPPGYYLVTFFATFWPAAAFAAIAAPYVWRHRHEDPFAFALAWTVPTWIVFEVVTTKLPHYVLPVFPAIAIATVISMHRGAVNARRLSARVAALLVPLFAVGVCLALGFAAWRLEGVLPVAGLTVLAAAAVLGVVSWRLFLRDDIGGAALAAVASAAVVAVGAFGLVQPTLQGLKLSPRLAAVARGLDCPDPRVATLGYREPSFVFLAGTGVRFLATPSEAAAFATDGGCRLTFVDDRQERGFLDEVARRGTRATQIARVAGFNINGGRRVDVGAYVVRP